MWNQSLNTSICQVNLTSTQLPISIIYMLSKLDTHIWSFCIHMLSSGNGDMPSSSWFMLWEKDFLLHDSSNGVQLHYFITSLLRLRNIYICWQISYNTKYNTAWRTLHMGKRWDLARCCKMGSPDKKRPSNLQWSEIQGRLVARGCLEMGTYHTLLQSLQDFLVWIEAKYGICCVPEDMCEMVSGAWHHYDQDTEAWISPIISIFPETTRISGSGLIMRGMVFTVDVGNIL